jgi:hypothetical protein
MPKAIQPTIRKWMICHYEDEPYRVDFPELIEIGLFQHPGVTDVMIESETDAQSHTISFVHSGVSHAIFYEIQSNVEEMKRRSSDLSMRDDQVLLNIIDLSINGNREYGISIVKSIRGSIGDEFIWFLTGYVADTRRLFEENEMEFRIISKPTNPVSVSNDILAIILHRISQAE